MCSFLTSVAAVTLVGFRFIRALELRNKLLRNYSQNIDALENAAGVSTDRLVRCHGSFASATCTVCHRQVDAGTMREDVLAGRVPWCGCDNAEDSAPSENATTSKGVLKPDIVFFGEELSESFHQSVAADKLTTDLFLLIGSSLKVRPVAYIPFELPANVPQILINRERIRHHSLDVELLGDCDLIIEEICRRLGWQLPQSAQDDVATDTEEIEVDDLMLEVKGEDLLPSVEDLEKEESERKEKIQPVCTAAAITMAATASVEDHKNSGRHGDGNDDEVAILDDSEIDDAHLVPTSLRQRFLCKLAERLSEQSFAHIEPNKYVFRGCTEIYDNLLSDDSESEEMDSNEEVYSEEETELGNDVSDDDVNADGEMGTSRQPFTISDDDEPCQREEATRQEDTNTNISG